MRVTFRDATLALIETDGYAQAGLPVSVVIASRAKLNFIRQAKDERDLLNWRSLRYRKHDENHETLRVVELEDEWSIVLGIISEPSGPEISVLKVEVQNKKREETQG